MHAGHIAFGLRAEKVANLDDVYFMPEREPRGKHPEHYGHRVSMLRRALRPYRKMHVLESVERRFAPRTTLNRLQQKFPEAQFIFLLGSDLVNGLNSWPHVEELLHEGELCIALRQGESSEHILSSVNQLATPPQKLWIVESDRQTISSSAIRLALGANKKAVGLLKSVYSYARREWLYISK